MSYVGKNETKIFYCGKKEKCMNWEKSRSHPPTWEKLELIILRKIFLGNHLSFFHLFIQY